MRHLNLFLLLGIVILSAIIKLTNLSYTNFWLDEIYTLMVANGHLPPTVLDGFAHTAQDYYQHHLAWQPMHWPTLIELLKINVHMPLYYLIVNPWMGFFGNNEFGSRSYSVLMSCLSIFPAYCLGKAINGKRFGLMTAFIMAFAPTQIYFAQEGRMYAQTLFFAVMAALGLWKLLYNQRPRRWCVFYTLSILGGVLSHYIFIFYLAFHLIFAGVEFIRNFKRRHLLFLFPLLGVVGIAIWWAPVYLSQQSGVYTDYHFAKGLFSWSRYLGSFFWQPLVMVAGDNNWIRLVYMPLTALTLLLYLGLLVCKKIAFSWRRDGFLLLWMQAPLLLQTAYDVTHQTHTVVIDRYALLIAPAIYMILAFMAERVFQFPWRLKALIPLGCVMLLVAIGMVQAGSPLRDEHNKKPHRDRLALMVKASGPKDLLIVNGPYGAPLFAAYYLNQFKPQQPILYWVQEYVGKPYPLPNQKLLADYEHVWFFKLRATTLRGREAMETFLNQHYHCPGYTGDWFFCNQKRI